MEDVNVDVGVAVGVSVSVDEGALVAVGVLVNVVSCIKVGAAGPKMPPRICGSANA